MRATSQGSQVVHFGAFEVDLRAAELRKDGLKIKLQQQPFQVLALLLERPGEVVTREEMRQRLWPADTYVDFGRAFNTSINKIREALGDSASHPRFTETLPRRRYRFIAPAESIAEAVSEDGHPQAEQGEPIAVRQRKIWWGAFAAVLVISLAVTFWGALRGGGDSPEAPMKVIPLTSYPGIEWYPSFSPEGTQVAFSWNGERQDNFDIYMKLIDGEMPLRLTTDPAEDSAPAWSPDGQTIAFLRWSEDRQRYSAYLISPLGRNERHFTDLSEGRSAPAWSPDGKFLALKDRMSPSDPFSIYLFSIETGEKRKITSPPADYIGDYGAAFSPDGQTLAFVRRESNAGDIYLAPVSGGEPRQLTFDKEWIAGLAWTADGNEIVFSSTRGSGSPYRLWRISVSGAATRKELAATQQDERRGGRLHPTISRQGHRLAYEQSSDPNFDIWRFESQGTSGLRNPPTKLIESTRQDTHPQYSPDGSQIAFDSNRSGRSETWVSDSEGRNPRRLTSLGASWPSWSPDGRQIAFDSRRAGGNFDVYVIRVQGGQPKRLTTHPEIDMRPRWSPDGRRIYFCSNRSGDYQIWRVPAQGGSPVQITRQGGFNGVPSPDGKFLYYGKAGMNLGRSHSIWRVPAAGGDEALVLEEGPRVTRAGWLPADGGLYFLQGGYLKFLQFDNGEVRRLIPVPVGPAGFLSLSPDRRWLVRAQAPEFRDPNERRGDLMLVENFR